MKKTIIYTSTLFIFLFILLPVLSFTSPSSAGIQSQSYKIPAYVLNGGGLQILSDNFRQVVSIGESTPIGLSQSDNFINNSGFIPQIAILPPEICDADVDNDCDLDVIDLVLINRCIQGFTVIVPSIWRESNPYFPPDDEISLKVDECKDHYNVDTIDGLTVLDLVIINRYIQGFSIIVPTLWREIYPEIPPDLEIAPVIEALKPACSPAKVRKRELIRYSGYEGAGLLGIEDLSAYGGEEDIRVPVYLDTNASLFSITFDVRFDPEKLEAKEIEKNDTRVKVSLAPDAIDKTNGRIIVNILDMNGETAVTAGQGRILDLVFDVKVTPETTQYTTLTLQDLRSVYEITGQSLSISLQNGIITIEPVPYCYSDIDSDTYGDPNQSTQALICPQGYVKDRTDCNDIDPNINPGGMEICDQKDNNCDGTVDEEGAWGCIAYYRDQDNDGYGLDGDTLCLCGPEGYYQVTMGGDPDDTDPNVSAIKPYCQFKAAITATGQAITGAGNTSTVIIGIDSNAYTYPFTDPTSPYTVIMKIAGGYSEDIRQPGFEEEWELNVTVGNEADPEKQGFFPVLTWDPNALCPTDPNGGYLSLYSENPQSIRSLLVPDMSGTGQYQTKEEDGSCFGENECEFTYYIIWSTDVSVGMELPEGWSMISLPLIPDSPQSSHMFPDATVIYGFQKGSGYIRIKEDEPLEPGTGYWILLPGTRTYPLTGKIIEEYAMPAEDGWLMIGGCTCSARAALNIGEIVVIYGFVQGPGYQRISDITRIHPEKGYWILFSNTNEQSELRLITQFYQKKTTD